MPPEAAPRDKRVAAGATPPAASFAVTTLTQRRDFLAAARARRAARPGMIVQGRARAPGETDESGIRVGFTCSKKVGNAVARNRAKRRLREVARLVLPNEGRPGWDYVLIGRAEVTASRDFTALTNDLRTALAKLHAT